MESADLFQNAELNELLPVFNKLATRRVSRVDTFNKDIRKLENLLHKSALSNFQTIIGRDEEDTEVCLLWDFSCSRIIYNLRNEKWPDDNEWSESEDDNTKPLAECGFMIRNQAMTENWLARVMESAISELKTEKKIVIS